MKSSSCPTKLNKYIWNKLNHYHVLTSVDVRGFLDIMVLPVHNSFFQSRTIFDEEVKGSTHIVTFQSSILTGICGPLCLYTDYWRIQAHTTTLGLIYYSKLKGNFAGRRILNNIVSLPLQLPKSAMTLPLCNSLTIT